MNAIKPIVTAPGIYSMPASTYHADPTPEPSLSASICKTLIEECPAKAWWKHPRLNPEFEPTESDTFDIGKAAHLIFLEPDLFADGVCIIKAEDYRTNAAKEARDLARLDGKVPLLAKQAAVIQGMHKALFQHSVAREAFTIGKAEQSVFSKDKDFGIWKRIRPDWTPDHHGHIVDYKTDVSANPDRFGKKAFDQAYYQRAAFYLDTFAEATGSRPDKYWFVVQEKEAPYLVSVIELSFHDLDAGREENRRAAGIFAKCLSNGTHYEAWPGYRRMETPDRDSAFCVSMPGWAHAKVLDRFSALCTSAGQAIERRAAIMMNKPLSGG